MNKKILVVDDNPVILKLMTTLLEKEGHMVFTAKDGYSALNTLVSFIPDIIFVDLFMPKIGGDKLCHIIRKMPHLQGAYLIIISAGFSEMDIDYENLPADHFIAKGPYNEMAIDILSAIETSDSPGHKEAADRVVGPVKKYTPRRLTQELILQKYDLENILESIDDGILEIFSGKIIFANETAAFLLGYSEEELLVKDFIDLVKEKDRSRIQALMGIGCGKFGRTSQGNIATINHRQLKIKHFFKKGSASNSILLLSDVTGQNLVQLQNRHAQKVDVLANLSKKTHRIFRKQLDGIQESIAEIVNKRDDDDPARHHLDKINRHTLTMNAVNHQLALLSGTNKGNAINIEGPIQTGSETILIADNDVLVCEFNRLMLNDLGYKVVTSKNGKDAIDKYKARSSNRYNRIDLVILDMDLPDMTLGELLERFYRLNPEVDILISGERKAEYAKRLPSPTIPYDFIKKPFRLMQLSKKIRKILD
jgi:CheY-like chemotaxis protein